MHRVRLALLSLFPASLLIISGCGSQPAPSAADAGTNGQDTAASASSTSGVSDPALASTQASGKPATSTAIVQPEVVFETSQGNFKVRLDMKQSRMTAENFLTNYVDRDFYTGTVFHHVESGFMIAGGGFTSDGTAKETRTPIHNEAHNGVKNRRGTIAMARDAAYANSATSQFFINLTDNPFLDFSEKDGKTEFGYCVFGEVVEGMEVVDRIAQVPVKQDGAFPKLPAQPIVIQSVKRR